jgi:integrase
MPSSITKRGKKRWRASIMVNGKKREKLFPDNSMATKRNAALWEKEEKERLEKEQIGMSCLKVLDWAESYLDYVKDRFVDKTYKEKKSVFSNLLQCISPDDPVEKITPATALKYLSKQANERSGNASNKERKNLVAAWNWGSKYLDGFPTGMFDPFGAVDKFPEIKKPRYIPPEKDFWQVYNNIHGQDKIMLLTYLHLAARRGEVFNLEWDDIDFIDKQIRLWTSKRKGGTKEFDWVPMTQDLRSALKLWWDERPLKSNLHVFVCLDDTPFCEQYFGKPFTNRQHFMKKVCIRAGVKPFGFHAIRHLTASILYHKGYKVSAIQAILRHKSPSTTNRYLKTLGLEETRTALEEGLQEPAKIIPFEKKKASGQ